MLPQILLDNPSAPRSMAGTVGNELQGDKKASRKAGALTRPKAPITMPSPPLCHVLNCRRVRTGSGIAQ